MNDRKQQVILTARNLFVKKGFAATSVQDIINESQISKGTFYNYFSSKNECLIAILEHGHNETFLRRRELMIGQEITSKDILAKQISIHMLVTREHNLAPIFQAVHHSGDQDLKASVKRHHLAELTWLTRRLVDVYGKAATAVAPDCAVIMYGIIQHLMHVGTAWSKEKIDTNELINFTMRRIDAIITNMLRTEDHFLAEDIFLGGNLSFVEISQTKKQLLSQLKKFKQTVINKADYNTNEYIQFLMDEIHTEYPRTFILESVTRSFREAFVDTDHKREVDEISANVWRYIDTIEDENSQSNV